MSPLHWNKVVSGIALLGRPFQVDSERHQIMIQTSTVFPIPNSARKRKSKGLQVSVRPSERRNACIVIEDGGAIADAIEGDELAIQTIAGLAALAGIQRDNEMRFFMEVPAAEFMDGLLRYFAFLRSAARAIARLVPEAA